MAGRRVLGGYRAFVLFCFFASIFTFLVANATHYPYPIPRVHSDLPGMLRDFVTGGLMVLGLASRSSGTILYASSYAGNVTTLNFTQSGNSSSLSIISSTDGCEPNPSWLTLDSKNGVLYCADEGLTTKNGTLSSFKTAQDGVLTRLDKVQTINDPVFSVIYGDGDIGLATPHYVGSGLSAWNISNPATIELVESTTWTMNGPGPVPSRQDAPHPHESSLDPTGNFLLVPDLGADLVRIFSLDNETLRFTPLVPYQAAPGSGPRHAVFFVKGNTTLMYLVSEIANTITTLELVYGNNTLALKELDIVSTHGRGTNITAPVKVSEIVISPDHKWLIVASRLEDNYFMIPNFDSTNSTKIPSDPLFTYPVDQDTGMIGNGTAYPAGGMDPRQFSINKDGTLVAVGLQDDGRVVIIPRDPATGELGDFLAHAPVEGQVTCVVFDE